MADIVSLGASEHVTPELLGILARHDPQTVVSVLMMDGDRIVGSREGRTYDVVLHRFVDRPLTALTREPRFVAITNLPDREYSWELTEHIGRHLGVKPFDLTRQGEPTGGAL